MSSTFGSKLKVIIFGESHGRSIGVAADGLPAGEEIDEEELLRFMARRRPGSSSLTTSRSESDIPVFTAGLTDGKTNGFPLCAIIENSDARSQDYSEFWDTPRPSHADYTARARYGDSVDMRGSGHFSGRLTAPLCVIGGVAKQILARRNIYVGAHLLSVGGVWDDRFPLHPDRKLFEEAAKRTLPVINPDTGAEMERAINSAREAGDSVGGLIECAVTGLPAGLGSPMFDGVENRISGVVFGVPAVKGLEFGAGFRSAGMRGSEANDPYIIEDGRVMTEKNDNGGITGGITNGMPVVFTAAIKPTPSISVEQKTVSLSGMEEARLKIKGRHDPCVALRAVPVIEAAAACAVLDLYLEEKY